MFLIFRQFILHNFDQFPDYNGLKNSATTKLGIKNSAESKTTKRHDFSINLVLIFVHAKTVPSKRTSIGLNVNTIGYSKRNLGKNLC